jgi:hypothetical protein
VRPKMGKTNIKLVDHEVWRCCAGLTWRKSIPDNRFLALHHMEHRRPWLLTPLRLPARCRRGTPEHRICCIQPEDADLKRAPSWLVAEFFASMRSWGALIKLFDAKPEAAAHFFSHPEPMDEAMRSQREHAQFLALAHMARTRAIAALREMP